MHGGSKLYHRSGKFYMGSCSMKDKVTTLITTFGDVNGDKLIDAKDVLAIRKFLVNDIPAEFLARFADVNADGEVTAQDVLKLRKYLVDAGNVILGEK